MLKPRDPMNYRYPKHQIAEIISSKKCLSDGHAVDPERKGEHGAKFDASLDLIDGPAFCPVRYIGKAGHLAEPPSYDATFLLDDMRVRGVGHCAVPRQNFRAKLRIPAGWHQNICDPNVPTDHAEWNRHEPLPEFAPTDFRDFVSKVADIWRIDLNWEGKLL